MTHRDETAQAAVLFDMDGLLIDSEPLWLQAERSVMARLGSGWTEADQVALLGGSLDRTVRYLLAKAARPAPPEIVGEWLMADICDRVRRDGVPLRLGARELLAAVARVGLPRALVTSSERSFMNAVLASTGLRFDALVCADDVAATKPDPEPYLLAAKLGGLAQRRGVGRGRRVPGHRGALAGADRPGPGEDRGALAARPTGGCRWDNCAGLTRGDAPPGTPR